MDINLIKKLVRILDTSGITDLEIEENGFKVRIAKRIKNSPGSNNPQTLVQTGSVITPSLPPKVGEAIPSMEKAAGTTENLHEIRSPIVGTFYRAPAPDADSYVQVGDNVSTGSVLCIIVAMKLMNEIESDVSGVVVKILVENGKPVEFNQPLFLIQPS